MQIDLRQFHEAFFEEAAENHAALEQGLLGLEKTPGDAEILNGVFRAAHSIKGGSSTFGFTDVARFTHVVEGLLDEVREGRRALTAGLSDLLLRSCDELRALLDAARLGARPSAESEAMIAELQQLFGGAMAAPPALTSPALTATATATAPALTAPASASAPVLTGPALREWRIRFRPASDIFRSGSDPLLVLRELGALGRIVETQVDTRGVPPLAALDPELCYLAWTLRLQSACTEQELREVFCFVEDGSDIAIEEAPGDGAGLEAAAPPREQVTHPAPSTHSAPASATHPDPESTTHSAAASATHPAPASATHPAPAAPHAPPFELRATESGSIRVGIEKVDKLVNLVGELVVTQLMVTQALTDSTPAGLARLRDAVAEMGRNTRELQERVMSVRMVPMSTVFSRFHRVVRDLAGSLGKQIELAIEGEETELDRGLIEKIGDPLTHLVRNAADHGLETAEERLRNGKPAVGHIKLTARHQSGEIVLEVSDDGRGLDTDRIRRKAVAQGLIGPTDTLTTEQVHALVFAPGFSTAETVTSVSGRGVGMDVVKRNLELLGGSVTLLGAPGAGTTCRLRLPLTMAILDGLTLRVGEQQFVVPLTSIVETFQPRLGDVRTLLNRGEMVMLRGEPVPLVRLHRIFRLKPDHEEATLGLAVVADVGGNRVALLVDELCGQAQVVVKSLEQNFRRIDGLTGASILGDGKVALIIDVQAVVRQAAARSAA